MKNGSEAGKKNCRREKLVMRAAAGMTNLFDSCRDTLKEDARLLLSTSEQARLQIAPNRTDNSNSDIDTAKKKEFPQIATRMDPSAEVNVLNDKYSPLASPSANNRTRNSDSMFNVNQYQCSKPISSIKLSPTQMNCNNNNNNNNNNNKDSDCNVGSKVVIETYSSITRRVQSGHLGQHLHQHLRINRLHHHHHQQQQQAQCPNDMSRRDRVKRSRASLLTGGDSLFKPSRLVCLIAAIFLVLSSCYLATNRVHGAAPASDQSAETAIEVGATGTGKASARQDHSYGGGGGGSSKSNQNERSDTIASGAGGDKSEASQSPSSSQASIVASISSAVATAAAAAAVAAAQSSLSGSDARSLASAQNALSGHNPHHHHIHQQAHRGLNLALKFADTIPEVPYHILHNMKKLDHAAPFYNVAPNKVSSTSTTKEAAQNFLTSALAASSGNLGSATESLGSLFRSPLWKRLADGYGEFTSEFRSLFRGPLAGGSSRPIKGSAGGSSSSSVGTGTTSVTSKFLRDISVPALLMLAMSTISSDWRPVRTRRKSFSPVVAALPSASEPNGLQQSALSGMPSFLAQDIAKASQTDQQQQQQQQQQQSQQSQNFAPSSMSAPGQNLMSDTSSAPVSSWTDQMAAANGANSRATYNQQQQQQQQQQIDPNPIAHQQQQQYQYQYQQPNYLFNLQQPALPMEVAASSGGIAPSSWLSTQVGASPQQMMMSGGGQDQQQSRLYGLPQASPEAAVTFQQQQQQQQEQQQPIQQTVRRSGEIAAAATADLSPSSRANVDSPVSVSQQHQRWPARAFSSLTSNLALAEQAKLIGKLFNANVGSDANVYKLMSLVNYGDDDGTGQASPTIKRDQLGDQQRYSLIGPEEETSGSIGSGGGADGDSLSPSESAVAHAAASQLNAPQPSESGSASSSPSLARGNFLSLGNLQRLIAERTINQQEGTFMRRQPVQAEQRDLTKLLPESWREVVKRTMSTVQQQANTQWKSIEGQLANWVQDKLKSVAATAGSALSPPSAAAAVAAAGSSSSGPSAAPQTPIVANMLASMSSTALNILGLNKNATSSSSSSSHSHAPGGGGAAAAAAAATAPSATDLTVAATANQRGKIEKKNSSPSHQQQPQPSKGALAGVASVIKNTLALRGSSSSPSAAPTAKITNLAPSTHSTTMSTTVTNNNRNDLTKNSQPADDERASLASKYPTLTGLQPEPVDKAPSSSSLSSSSSSSSSSTGGAAIAGASNSMQAGGAIDK